MLRFLVRHIGIEVMHSAQALIGNADKLFLSPTRELDFYSCPILDVVVVKEGRSQSLAVLLATQGYTMSFYNSAGMHVGINECMRKAIANAIGMFNLPVLSPNRPRELRAQWNPVEETYRNHIPISNPTT